MATGEKRRMYGAFAEFAAALSSPLRLMLLELLAQGERSVQDLAAEVEARLGNTSAQLQVLRAAGLVETRREGTRIYYRLAEEGVVRLVDELEAVALRRRADVERAAAAYLGPGGAIEMISREELRRRLREDSIVVIDVRPEMEYEAGHLPGARSIPLEDLAGRLGELPADAEVVAYCRGPFCALAPRAARLLAARGIRALVLEDGFPEWRLRGMPVKAGADRRRAGRDSNPRPTA